jgi:hypothetical protein
MLGSRHDGCIYPTITDLDCTDQVDFFGRLQDCVFNSYSHEKSLVVDEAGVHRDGVPCPEKKLLIRRWQNGKLVLPLLIKQLKFSILPAKYEG